MPLTMLAVPRIGVACVGAPPIPSLIVLLLFGARLYFGGTLVLLGAEYLVLCAPGGDSWSAKRRREEFLAIAWFYLGLAASVIAWLIGIEILLGWDHVARWGEHILEAIVLGLYLAPPLGAPFGRLVFFGDRIRSRPGFLLAAVPLVGTAFALICFVLATLW